MKEKTFILPIPPSNKSPDPLYAAAGDLYEKYMIMDRKERRELFGSPDKKEPFELWKWAKVEKAWEKHRADDKIAIAEAQEHFDRAVEKD